MLTFSASRPAAVTLVLTMPPSTNNLFVAWKAGTGRGRRMSEPYRVWKMAAGWELKTQIGLGHGAMSGFHALLTVHTEMRGDIDNRCKGVFDLLKQHGVIVDDKHLSRLGITRSGDQKPGTMTVELWNEEEGT